MIPPEVAAHEDAAALLNWNAEVLQDGKLDRGELTLVIDRNWIDRTGTFLKGSRGYSFLSDITAVDWWPSEPRFEVVYHLFSPERKTRLRLKCRVSEEEPVLPTVSTVWSAANWYEREVFDLFGVRFHNHPNLVRILLPEDWEGHPLRKDYPVTGYR